MSEKKCSKCLTIKNIDEFHADKSKRDGHYSSCKLCVCERINKWHKKHPDKKKEASKKWYVEHSDQVKARAKKWAAAHPLSAKESRKKYRVNNPDKLNAKTAKWRKEHPYMWKAQYGRSHRKIYSTTKGKLNVCMSGGISKSLQRGLKAGRHWETLVGYTVDQLKKHLEKRFLPGMTWENYGQWHIDHKTPVSVFNYECPEDVDFKKCWALKNLQPMWALDNIRKYNKLDKPFQPSLTI